MALTNFFNINLPYGMRKIENNTREVYNREYQILWWNQNDWGHDYPIELQTEYARFTDKFIEKHIPSRQIHRNEKTWEIISLFFYDDWTNPWSDIKHWDKYSKILKQFSKIQRKNNY